ncbi:MAG: hypothetical protein U0136_06870 [Bdellovibrionota bacterium]
MALIDGINGKFLTQLSGGSASSGGSKINGLGTGSSFGSASNVSSGLNNLATAFSDSVVRLSSPVSAFSAAAGTVTQLVSLTDEMIHLAERASSDDLGTGDREIANIAFQRKAQQYRTLLARTSRQGFDLREKGDLEKILKASGVDPSASTTLASFFRALATTDGEIGYENIRGEDVSVTGTTADITLGSENTDPLKQDLKTRSGATVAYRTLTKLKANLEDDLKGVKGVLTELRGSLEFAREAGIASDEATRTLDLSDVNAVANTIRQQILTRTRDADISEHSDLDRTLVKQLTGKE